ncbi:MAG: TonB-dependent receptor [Bacteroidota bacterium]
MIRIISSLIVLLISLVSSLLFAQETPSKKISITGNVLSEKNEVVSNVVVSLMDSETKKLIKAELTSENGGFSFTNVDKGSYFIKVVENEKTKAIGETFIADKNTELPSLILKSETTVLDEVKVVKAKPYIERQQGKMILNVESSIGNTGSSAFEVLEKAPGVTIDNNDNISLRGRSGIVIQIDGKPTPMSGANLANFLKGMPSGSIDKIEFITNPSSKYDAAGSSIINIKLKKDKKIGTNGSITSALGQGSYPKSNNNISVNHRNKKINAFGSYSFAYREGFNHLVLERKFYENNVFDKAYEQDNYLKMNFRNHIGRAGVDYFASKKHTFGITASKVSNKFNPTGKNVSKVFDENYVQESRFETNNNSRDNWHNHAVNLNHKYVIDSLGTELTTDADYANYGNKTEQNFTTRYFNTNNVESQAPYLLYGDIKGKLNIYSLKTDFVTTLKNKIKLETGVKTSYVKADNNLAFYDKSSGVPVYDATKSNHFIYKENINAAYFLSSKEFGKWNITLGLRVENTNITGLQVVNNTSVEDDYTQLFPNMFVNYAFNDNHGLEFNYSRRISRPSYDQLNPFKFFLDPTTYKEGNPYLKPQTTHSYEVTHVFKQKIFSTLNFSRTTNNITEVVAPSDDNPLTTVQTNKNLNTVDVVGLFMIIPVQVTKWWNMNNSMNFYYGSYSGTVANTTLKNQGNFTCNFNSVNNFKLGSGFTSEITANYRAREVYAFMDVDPIWFVNCGFQKKFKNNSSLKLAVNDIFYTNRSTAESTFNNYIENFKVSRDTRVAVVTYTYNFGAGNPTARRKTGGADDLKQRAGSTNG